MSSNVRILFAILIFGLASCGNDPAATEVRDQLSLIPVIRAGAQEPGPAALARSALSSIRGSVLLATREDTGGISTLVPVRETGGVSVWRTGSNQTIALRNDRIVATRGLGDDLMASDRGASGTDEGTFRTEHLAAEERPKLRTWECGPFQSAVDIVSLSSGERVVATRRHRICTDGIDEIESGFWVDPKGQVRMSRQWISPGVGYLRLEHLR